MGEVYRARDSRLDREVAIKVLPGHLSASAELRQRFEREARAVSSLNHPNICTLHDIGHQEGIDFLVLELLDGETLAQRLERGPLPVPEALRMGIQIADALEKAHSQALIHRDLKPGNIMLTKSGAVLMDFGLAKTTAPEAATSSTSTPTKGVTPTAARTAASPLTTEGAILGTFQYMSPEQLEGHEADARADIFALGLVLHESLTGRPAFRGKTQASLIAEILKGEPADLTALQPDAPPALGRTVRTCLSKDPDDRFQSVHDVKLQLQWISEGSGEAAAEVTAAGAAGSAKAPPKRSRLPWMITTAAVFAAMVGWINFVETESKLAEATKPVTFSVNPPRDMEFSLADRSSGHDFSISPDGRMLVFGIREPNAGASLWVREMDLLAPRRLAGTEEGEMPFWSPDGRSIGFFAQGKVKKVSVAGGPVHVLCDWPGGNGGTWSEDGVILFGGVQGGGGIMKVSADGGLAEEITEAATSEGGQGYAERARHEWPVFLPGGDRYMYLQFSGRTSERAIFVGSLDATPPVRLIESGFKAGFVEPNWIIFVQRSSLMAQRFSLDSLDLLGSAYVILDGIAQHVIPGTAAFSASAGGHFAYRTTEAGRKTRLTWYSREGKALEDIGDDESLISVSLSPDGRVVSVSKPTGGTRDGIGIGEAPVDIWNIDLSRGIKSRFTSRPASSDENPVWSPDGRRISYASHQNGIAAVYARDASGAGEESLLYSSEDNPHPIDWSPDGRHLLVQISDTLGTMDLAVLDLEDPDAGLDPWLGGSRDEGQGQFSPDGRWIAYTSSESGTPEVYVRPFPRGEGKWQLSGGGGRQPRWRDDGRELYYITHDGNLMAVEVTPGEDFVASAPVPLFDAGVLAVSFYFYGNQANYDVGAGGRRFLVNRDVGRIGGGASTIDVILNWARPEGQAR
jgi:serine/threonine protein kinase